MLLLGWQTHCPRRRTSADINIVNVVRTHLATTAENRTNRIVYGFFSGLSCVERSNQTANFLLNKIDLNALNEQNNKLYRFDTIDPIRIWIWTSLVRSCGWCRREDSIYSLFWLMLTWLFSSQWQTWMTLCRSCCRSWWSVALLCANLIILGSRGPLSQVSIAWLVTSCISSVFVFCVDNLILCFLCLAYCLEWILVQYCAQLMLLLIMCYCTHTDNCLNGWTARLSLLTLYTRATVIHCNICFCSRLSFHTRNERRHTYRSILPLVENREVMLQIYKWTAASS